MGSATRRPGRLDLAVVAVFVAAQLGQMLHHVLVEHRRCAEHGDIVHADARHAHGAAGGRASTGVTAPPVDEREQHDVCPCATVQRARFAVAPLEVRAALEVAGGSTRAPAHGFAHAAVPLTRAPKTSPPA